VSALEEIDKEQADRLFELLLIKKEAGDTKITRLDEAIKRAKASMTNEAISWVEKLANG
jgi:hypothetical protein